MSEALTAEEIRTEIDRILTSRYFSRSRSLSRFLRFVVEQTLVGLEDDLKEYTIGVRVFERGEKFDPRIDPIVRVQASKLRERLDRYYHNEGSVDKVRIFLKPGSYVPTFEAQPGNGSQTISAYRKRTVRVPETPSLVVLPFLNLTGDPEFEYFSDGLSEELIGLVGRITGLRVIARTSSFAFKGTNAGLAEIGQALRSNLVLEGSVRRSVDVIRVTARLNDAPTGHQIWARQYDGQLEDVLAVQDEIAGQIAGTLWKSVHDTTRLQSYPHAANLDSRLLLLQAWHHWNKNSPESLCKAVECFERAVSADPANALAHAGLAFAWTVLSAFAAVPPEQALEKAGEAAEQAVHHGPEMAEAWGAAGSVESALKWDWCKGERAFRQALEINPNHVPSRHGYAMGLLVALGRLDEAIRHMKLVLDLDPLSTMANCDLATACTYAGLYDEALRQYRTALDLEPNDARTRIEMGWTMLHVGQVQEGLNVIQGGLDQTAPIAPFLGIRALGLAMAGQRQEALHTLEEIRRASPQGQLSSNMSAFALDALGHREEALTEFERAYERRDPHLRFVNVDPRAALIRGEPRFQALIEKMGLARPSEQVVP